MSNQVACAKATHPPAEFDVSANKDETSHELQKNIQGEACFPVSARIRCAKKRGTGAGCPIMRPRFRTGES